MGEIAADPHATAAIAAALRRDAGELATAWGTWPTAWTTSRDAAGVSWAATATARRPPSG